MKIEQTANYIEVSGKDINGEFTVRIQNDGSQIQMETENGDAYIDTDNDLLRVIRDAISKVIDGD